MADKFDPYREALVVETATVWPVSVAATADAGQRAEIEPLLHADPAACSHLEYVRVHTGFCRRITVTAEDLARLAR
ncbi:MAG: hypothetical protein MUF48_08875 [Pirellulaceae bacterium]|nr:hypothetical protein [Pirellulaceae bacterium]